jgi:hypothetical protein
VAPVLKDIPDIEPESMTEECTAVVESVRMAMGWTDTEHCIAFVKQAAEVAGAEQRLVLVLVLVLEVEPAFEKSEHLAALLLAG